MPLMQFTAFKSSPSSVRILDVPRRIGEWDITSIYLQVRYPDNSKVTKECVRTGSVWVCTVDGCDVTGSVWNGYLIYADGKDERGLSVTGYILGAGDVEVMDIDSSVHPGIQSWTVNLLDSKPDDPRRGDAVVEYGTLKVYDGNEWSEQISAMRLDDGYNRIDANGLVWKKIDGSFQVVASLADSEKLPKDFGVLPLASVTPQMTHVHSSQTIYGLSVTSSTPVTASFSGGAFEWKGIRLFSLATGEDVTLFDLSLALNKRTVSGRYNVRIGVHIHGGTGAWTEDVDIKPYAAPIEYRDGRLVFQLFGDLVAPGAERNEIFQVLLEHVPAIAGQRYATLAEVPSSTEQLDNDSGYITRSTLPGELTDYAKKSDLSGYMPRDGKPTGNFSLGTDTNGMKWDSRGGFLGIHGEGNSLWLDNGTMLELEDGFEQIKQVTGTGAVYTYKTLPEYIAEETSSQVESAKSELSARIDLIEATSHPNMNIVGSPTFREGNVSGFSANDYLVFPTAVSVGKNTVEFHMAFHTGSDVNTKQNIMDSWCGLAFAIRGGTTVTAISTNGTSFLAESIGGTIRANNSYRLKMLFSYEAGQYRTRVYLADGAGDFTEVGTGFTADAPLFATATYWGGANPGHATHVFGGIINLNECRMLVNGVEVWRGYDELPMVKFDPTAEPRLDTADKIINKIRSSFVELSGEYEDGTTFSFNILTAGA